MLPAAPHNASVKQFQIQQVEPEIILRKRTSDSAERSAMEGLTFTVDCRLATPAATFAVIEDLKSHREL